MERERDPVERASDGSLDLYDISTWEPRTVLDRFSIRVHSAVVNVARAIVILVALVILVVQFVFSGLAALRNPAIGAFILLSVVPALALAGYVWRADVTEREPLGLIVVTFLLGVLFAGFAAILNALAQPAFAAVPIVGVPLFFYLIVGPVEETVKWLAVRLHAFRSPAFASVLDGAVYGAVAGLGFATIENSIYIGEQYLTALGRAGAFSPAFGAALGTAAVRTFAGPGHVIYSAFAGYYLGLAKFNREHAGPIVVKGLIIAALIHGTYNTLVSVVPALVHFAYPSVPIPIAFVGFVVLYDGIFGYALLRKISRYRAAYEATGAAAIRDADETDEASDDGPETGTESDAEAALDGDSDDAPAWTEEGWLDGDGTGEEGAEGDGASPGGSDVDRGDEGSDWEFGEIDPDESTTEDASGSGGSDDEEDGAGDRSR